MEPLAVTGLALHSSDTIVFIMVSLKKKTSRTIDVTIFIPHMILPFQNLEPTSPTMQLSH